MCRCYKMRICNAQVCVVFNLMRISLKFVWWFVLQGFKYLHCKKRDSGAGCTSIYSWKRIQTYPEIKLPSIHGFGSKYSWKNFLGFLTDDAITKSRKNYIVGIFSTRIQIQKKSGSKSSKNLDPIPVCAGTISVGLESGYGRSFRGNPKIHGWTSKIFFLV